MFFQGLVTKVILLQRYSINQPRLVNRRGFVIAREGLMMVASLPTVSKRTILHD